MVNKNVTISLNGYVNVYIIEVHGSVMPESLLYMHLYRLCTHLLKIIIYNEAGHKCFTYFFVGLNFQ